MKDSLKITTDAKMKNRILLPVFFALIFFRCIQSQSPEQSLTDFIQIKDPIVDNTLTRPSYAKLEVPCYIINSDHVVFQEIYNTRKILYADIASFRFPSIGNRYKHFALDRNGVYFNGILVETDTTGFQIVGEIQPYADLMWKTNDKVFLNTTEITENIDVPSFQTLEVFNRPYQADKNHIYYRGQKIEGSDGSTAMSVSDDLAYDKNYVYHKGEIALFEGDTIRSINHILGKTEKHVLKLNTEGEQGFQPGIQARMDAKTIKPLSRFYSIDKNGVYFLTEKTPVRPQNFKNVKVWDQVNSSRVSDGLTIYARAGDKDCPESDLDAKSFGMLPHSDFYFDKNGVYKRQYNDKLQKLSNERFPFVYTEAVSETNTFITDNSRYIVYKNQAYDPWEKDLYTNLTPEQIALIKENKLISTPKNQQKKAFDYRLYEVNNEIFWNGKKTIADAPTFKGMTLYEYYKDKRNIYKYDREKGLIPIQGIDVKTATTNKHNFLADKDYIFANNFRIIRNSNVELLAIFSGYQRGMNIAPYYYLFKNNEGYWFVLISDEVKIRYLGDKWNEDAQKILPGK